MIATNLVGALVEPIDTGGAAIGMWPRPLHRVNDEPLPRARVVAVFVAGMQDIELLLVDVEGRLFKTVPMLLRVVEHSPVAQWVTPP